MSDPRLPPIPPELRALMADIGPRWRESVAANVKLICERFSEVLKDAPRDGVTVSGGHRYGSHERQTFELFMPAGGADAARDRPVVIFVHGGAFVEGDRNRTTEIYSNVCVYFARHGVVAINMGYRLAPDAVYPQAAEDIAAVVKWTQDHAHEIGVSHQRIFLMGHSAGGCHVGTYAYDRRWQPGAGHGLAGVIIVSGRMRADNLPENPNARKVEAYFGADSSTFEDRSPVSHVDAQSPPTFVAWAEFENPLIDLYCAELVYRLGVAKRKTPPVVYMPGHNHTSGIAHINTADDVLGRALVDFVRKTSGLPSASEAP
ncbi:MAG: alpha/beta hydrolase [Beijerinckiaceae bacterium]|nr:alpha/beta hydrolase [Beijerinckiaceae bacterium]